MKNCRYNQKRLLTLKYFSMRKKILPKGKTIKRMTFATIGIGFYDEYSVLFAFDYDSLSYTVIITNINHLSTKKKT